MLSPSSLRRAVHYLLALVVLAAALAWALVAPAHARGLEMARTVPIAQDVAPCHADSDQAAAQADAGCAELCSIAAPDHFTGQIATAITIIDAVKLAVTALSGSPPSPTGSATAVTAAPDRYGDGPPYLLTGRLRI